MLHHDVVSISQVLRTELSRRECISIYVQVAWSIASYSGAIWILRQETPMRRLATLGNYVQRWRPQANRTFVQMLALVCQSSVAIGEASFLVFCEFVDNLSRKNTKSCQDLSISNVFNPPLGCEGASNGTRIRQWHVDTRHKSLENWRAIYSCNWSRSARIALMPLWKPIVLMYICKLNTECFA